MRMLDEKFPLPLFQLKDDCSEEIDEMYNMSTVLNTTLELIKDSEVELLLNDEFSKVTFELVKAHKDKVTLAQSEMESDAPCTTILVESEENIIGVEFANLQPLVSRKEGTVMR